MSFFRACLIAGLLGVTQGCGSDSQEPVVPDRGPADYLIVAADTLAGAAERYRQYRQATGHQVAVGLMSELVGAEVDPAAATAAIRHWVESHYGVRDEAAPFFLLILGDGTEDWAGDLGGVPTGVFVDGFNGDLISTDNIYADMDGDNLPDLAVGRIAVTTEAEVDLVRQKVEAFDSVYEVGEWNRRVNAFASTAGFGGIVDQLIEALAFDIVESASYDFSLSMTYAKQDSPFVYVPEQFSDKVYERINEGALWVAYVGHGNVDSFASLEWSGSDYPILDTGELHQLAVTHRQPILCLVACLTGAFDIGESLSERILKAPGGPSAIFSSTEISHPLTNAAFIYESSQVVTQLRPATLGEAFLLSKERMVSNQDALREEIDSFGATMLQPGQSEALTQTHLHMYTLFGDPAAQLSYPWPITDLTVAPATPVPGGALTITASLGELGTGSARVTLESKRSVLLTEMTPVPDDGEPDRDAVIAANYEAANDKVVASQTVEHSGGALSASLDVPADLPADDYYVKIYADDGTIDAMGSLLVTIGP